MAWRAPRDSEPGLEVPIPGSGSYLLYSACSCVKDCPAACNVGEWCNPNTGACAPDPCTSMLCASSETCTPAAGRCVTDCSKLDCDLGQSCDPLLGKCLTDRCINMTCTGGQDCDAESGVCTDPACDGWPCAAGLKLAENQKPAWITVQVDFSQLPQSGYWCDGSTDNKVCLTDNDCDAANPCRIRENIVVGVSNKNCISFKIKNITLMDTLETVTGFGAGLNNIYVYFAQTPLDNPKAFSIFRAALVQMRFHDGIKEPNVAEIPLSDKDFFAIEEN
jgi:hypothetical protein